MADTQYDEDMRPLCGQRGNHVSNPDDLYESSSNDRISTANDDNDSLCDPLTPAGRSSITGTNLNSLDDSIKNGGDEIECAASDQADVSLATLNKDSVNLLNSSATASTERGLQSSGSMATLADCKTPKAAPSQPEPANVNTAASAGGNRWSAAASGKSQSARARINAEQLIEEYAATVGYEQAVGYKLLREIVTLQANKPLVQSFGDSSDVCNAAGEFDVIESDFRFPLLNAMMDKFLNQEYKTFVAFVTDFRTMIACLERIFGSDHVLGKRATRLGTIFEQKLALLPRDMRTLVQNSGTPKASEIAELTSKRPQRGAAPTGHGASSTSQSQVAATVNEESLAESAKPPPIKFNYENVDIGVVTEWEQRTLHQQDFDAMRCMPELVETAVFLSGARTYLGFAPAVVITVGDLERALLVADRSSLLETIMTGLLRHRRDKMDKLAVTNTPCLVQVLTERFGAPSPFADPDTFVYNYEIWERKLRDQLAAWYKVLTVTCKNDVNEACFRLGIPTSFFERVGMTNPLANPVPVTNASVNEDGSAATPVAPAPATRFHQLSIEQRVLIVSALCNWVFSHVEALRHALLEQANAAESRETVLGRDSQGRMYVYLSHLREHEFRLFRVPSFDPHVFFGDETADDESQDDADDGEAQSLNESLNTVEVQQRGAKARGRDKKGAESIERRASPRTRGSDAANTSFNSQQQQQAAESGSESERDSGALEGSSDDAWDGPERAKPRGSAKRRRRAPASRRRKRATPSAQQAATSTTPHRSSTRKSVVPTPSRDGLRTRTRVQQLIAGEAGDSQDGTSQHSASNSCLSSAETTNAAAGSNDDGDEEDTKPVAEVHLRTDAVRSENGVEDAKLGVKYSFPLSASTDGTFELLADDSDSLRALITDLYTEFSQRWRASEHDTRKRHVAVIPKRGSKRSIQAMKRAALRKPTKAQLDSDFAAECESAERALIERLEELLCDVLETESKRAASVRERRVLVKRDDDEYGEYFERKRREREEEERRARLREALKRKHEEALAEERERIEQRRQAIADRIAKAREREEEQRKQRTEAKRQRVDPPYRQPIGSLPTGTQQNQPQAYGAQSRSFSSYVRDRDRSPAVGPQPRRYAAPTAASSSPSLASNPTMARLLGASQTSTSTAGPHVRPLGVGPQPRVPASQPLVARTYFAGGQQRTIAVASSIRPQSPAVNGQSRVAPIVCYQPTGSTVTPATRATMPRPNGTQILIQRTVPPNVANTASRPIVSNAGGSASWAALGTVRPVSANMNPAVAPPLRSIVPSVRQPAANLSELPENINGVALTHSAGAQNASTVQCAQLQAAGTNIKQLPPAFAPRAPFRLYNIDNQLWTIDGVAARIVENRVMLMRTVQPSAAVLRALSSKRAELVGKPSEAVAQNAPASIGSANTPPQLLPAAPTTLPQRVTGAGDAAPPVDGNARLTVPAPYQGGGAQVGDIPESTLEQVQVRSAPSISTTVRQSAVAAAQNGFDEHAFDEHSALHNAPISSADILAESGGALDL